MLAFCTGLLAGLILAIPLLALWSSKKRERLKELLREAYRIIEKLRQNDFHVNPDKSFGGTGQKLLTALSELSIHLQSRQETINRLEQMRIDFVANVSHELKTPLTSIKGYTETLKGGAIEDPQARMKFLDRIEANSERLTALINDLLALSRLERSSNDVSWEIFDSHSLSDKLDATFSLSLAQKKQTLRLQFSDTQLEGDRSKLEQVLINLVDNAHRYTPEGSLITIEQSKDETHWHYHVSDNGPGISAEHVSRIFERFYRVNPDRNRNSGGTGLGLAIVKHAVIAHGGSVDAESHPGEGLSFHIRLPRHTL